jgi:hypothetical protein
MARGAAAKAASTDKPKPLEQKIFREFGGMNTQAYRTSIKDTEFAWLENVIPIGHGNLRCVPAQSATLQTIGAHTISMRYAYNIAGVDYCAYFCTDGAAFQVQLTTPFTVTTIGTAGTFSGSGVDAVQWNNLGILIVDPSKGYFDWNITVANALSSISSALSALTVVPGTGYTTRPTLAFAGGGAGATQASATVTLVLISATVSAAGSGYLVSDVLTFVGGTSTSVAQVRVATVSGTAVATVTVFFNGSYTVLPSSPVSVTGGSGTGATFTFSFGLSAATITSTGANYTSPPSVTVVGGSGTGATVTAAVNGTLNGTQIAVYAGRAWIANNRTINFTDALSYNGFALSGGSFLLEDPTLHSGVNAFSVANNFLYIFGGDSINVISDVRVVSGITLFSNVNIQSSVGCNFPLSVFPYYRAVFFASKYGFFSLYGSTPQKISDELDGIFQLMDLTMPIYGGAVLLYNILCAGFMFTYKDPLLGPRPLLAIYHDKKWFVASQGATMLGVVAANVNGFPLMFADDGANISQLFSSTTASIATTIIPKLFDMGDSILDKQPIKFGMEVINPSSTVVFTVTVDSEFGSGTPLSFSGGNVFQWTNNVGTVFGWTNNAAATFSWVSSGFNRQMQDVLTGPTRGKYLSGTLTSTTPGYQLAQLAWQYMKRADW